MKVKFQLGSARMTPTRLATALIAALLAQMAAGGTVIDRIVATVNRRVILESEWDEAVRFECLLNGRALGSVTADDRRKTLDRLIDQSLIRQQMEMEKASFPRASIEEITRQLQHVRAQNAQWAHESDWRLALATYGLNADEVAEQVSVQLDILRFVESRFRPSIRIERNRLEEYYHNQLIPELRRSGAPEVPLKEVAPKIEELLIQRQMDEMLNTWLRTLRMQSDVQVR